MITYAAIMNSVFAKHVIVLQVVYMQLKMWSILKYLFSTPSNPWNNDFHIYHLPFVVECNVRNNLNNNFVNINKKHWGIEQTKNTMKIISYYINDLVQENTLYMDTILKIIIKQQCQGPLYTFIYFQKIYFFSNRELICLSYYILC